MFDEHVGEDVSLGRAIVTAWISLRARRWFRVWSSEVGEAK